MFHGGFPSYQLPLCLLDSWMKEVHNADLEEKSLAAVCWGSLLRLATSCSALPGDPGSKPPPRNVSCAMSPAKNWKCCKFRFKISRYIEETSSKLRPWNWKSCEAVHFIYNSIESVGLLDASKIPTKVPKELRCLATPLKSTLFFCSDLRYPTQLGDKVCEPKNSKKKCSTVTLLYLGYDPHPSNSHHQDYSITFSVVDSYTPSSTTDFCSGRGATPALYQRFAWLPSQTLPASTLESRASMLAAPKGVNLSKTSVQHPPGNLPGGFVRMNSGCWGHVTRGSCSRKDHTWQGGGEIRLDQQQ